MNYQIAISLFGYAAHPRGICFWPIIAAVSVVANVCTVDASYAATKTWRADTGSWHVAGNWNGGIPVAGDRADIENGGIARILATIPDGQTPNEIYVGNTGVGTLEHLSGVMTGETTALYLGHSATGNGTYRVGGAAEAYLHTLYAVNGNWRVEVNSGQLQIHTSFFGPDGAFVHNGGKVVVRDHMSMAGRFELANEARLDALESLVSSRWLTVSGNFVQSGGEAVLDNLEVVVLGRYEMSGGSLSSRNFQMHGGRFELAGGRMAPGYFRIRPPQQPDDLAGVFTVRGGTLVLDQGISENSLGIDFESGAWTLDVPSGIAALDTSRMNDVSAATLRTGPDSLVVLPAGVELSDFATVDAQGMVHRNGTTLTIPQGRTISGGGNLSDYVVVEGTLRNEDVDNPYASELNLNGGVSIGPTASVNLGDGTLIANGLASELRGGELRASYVYVGHRQPGRITHSAGLLAGKGTFLDMNIGYGVEGYGEYEISGSAEIRTSNLKIGDQDGTGVFRQAGGKISSTDTRVRAGSRLEQEDGEIGGSLFAVDGHAVLKGKSNFHDVGVSGDSNGGLEVLSQSHRFNNLGITGRAGETPFVRIGETADVRIGSLQFNTSGDGRLDIDGGKVHFEYVNLGSGSSGRSAINVNSSAAVVEFAGEVRVGPTGVFNAVPNTRMHVLGGSFSGDHRGLPGLNNATFVFGQGSEVPLEVSSRDWGTDRAGLRKNFALAGIDVGDESPASVRLVNDEVDQGGSPEATYARKVVVGPGSTLDLNGNKLYYDELSIDPAGQVIMNGGQLIRLGLRTTFAHTLFEGPSVGVANFAASDRDIELGFVTTTTPTGGSSPQAAISAASGADGQSFVHRSLNAITTFDRVNLMSWTGATVSIDLSMGNTEYEDSDRLRVSVTDGTQFVNLVNLTGAGTTGLDAIAGGGQRSYSANIPANWTRATLVIDSSTNSSGASEFFLFHRARFTGNDAGLEARNDAAADPESAENLVDIAAGDGVLTGLSQQGLHSLGYRNHAGEADGNLRVWFQLNGLNEPGRADLAEAISMIDGVEYAGVPQGTLPFAEANFLVVYRGGGLPGASGVVTYDFGPMVTVAAVAIPEPNGALLALLGMFGAGCSRVRRNRSVR